MNRIRNLERPHGAVVTIAAALSTLIAIGILAGVTGLFQGRGAPAAQLAAVKHA